MHYIPQRAQDGLTQLVLAAGAQGAVVLSRQQFQLSSTFNQISLFKPMQSLDVVKVCPQVDANGIGGVLLEGMDAGLPLLHRGPITECYIALTGFVGQEVHHLGRTL